MQDSEQLLLVIEAAPIAVVIADAGGRIVLVNAQAGRLFGYDRDELIGALVEQLIPERFRRLHPGLRAGYLAAPATRAMGAGRDLFGLRKDGVEVPIEIGLNPVSTPQGQLTVATIADITERKNAEDLRRERDRALDASSLKSQFVATMSHELRTPLNAIIATAELLSRGELDERQRAFVETIDEYAEALLSIISSILDFSKIEAGKLDLVTRAFELEQLVEGAAAVLTQQARQKGVRLHVYVDPSIPGTVRGDAERLRQILLNLIANAVKFTATGKIFVRALPAEVSSRHAVVRFEVEDSGIGIHPEVVPKLFEPFVQADSSSSRRFGGTGLGLSISKRLVELMQGEIGVTSEPGRGSLFWFTARFGRPNAAVEARRLIGVRALLISADDEFNQIAARYTEAWGIDTHRVRTALEALEAAQTAAPGSDEAWVAIVDVDTVDADVTARILAAHGMASRSILLAGADERLSRPLRQSQLFDRIVQALGEEPAAPPPSQVAAPASPTAEASVHKVLVAEDNEGLQEILVHQFAQLGVPVKIVGNGAAAVDELRRGSFALVFMDCQMPEMDGFAATRAIRAAESGTGRHVPIVALTANAFKEDREACLAVGMDDYLAKPVRIDDLRGKLDRWAIHETFSSPT